jgi:hypothetical protein
LSTISWEIEEELGPDAGFGSELAAGLASDPGSALAVCSGVLEGLGSSAAKTWLHRIRMPTIEPRQDGKRQIFMG